MVNPSPTRHRVVRSVLQSICLNGVLPLMLFTAGKSFMPEIPALTVAVAIPACVDVLLSLRERRVDVLGCFLLAGVLLSLGAVLLGGDRHLLLLRDALVTGVMGTAMLASLLFPRPLIYYFAARFEAGNDPDALSRFAVRWELPRFRRTMYLMTTVWGCVMLAEALIRGVLVFHMSTTAFLAISPLIQYGMIGATIGWTVCYVRRLKREARRVPVSAREAGASADDS